MHVDLFVDTRYGIGQQGPERLLIGVSLGASGEASVCQVAYTIRSMLGAYRKRLAQTKGAVYIQGRLTQPT
jgi:hypothetical protein